MNENASALSASTRTDCSTARRAITPPRRAELAAGGPMGPGGLRESRQDLEHVAHQAVVGDLEDRGVLVLVDRDDVPGGRHAGQVLDRAADAARDVER